MTAKTKINDELTISPLAAAHFAEVLQMDVTTARKALNQLADEGKAVVSLDERTKLYAMPSVAKKVRKTRGKSIGTALAELAAEKGIDNVTFEQATERAKTIKPDTSFNKRHWSWYKMKIKQGKFTPAS